MGLNEPGATYARVTFTEFLATDAPMLLAWVRFRSMLTGLPEGGPRTDRPHPARRESGLWRLLATNNRELGRSFLLYHRFETARAHVQQLQARPDSLSVHYVPGPSNGSRGWVVMAGDSPVMTCSRWYGSLSAGAVAAARAVDALGSAVLADAPDRSDASGRFRRRAAVGVDVRR